MRRSAAAGSVSASRNARLRARIRNWPDTPRTTQGRPDHDPGHLLFPLMANRGRPLHPLIGMTSPWFVIPLRALWWEHDLFAKTSTHFSRSCSGDAAVFALLPAIRIAISRPSHTRTMVLTAIRWPRRKCWSSRVRGGSTGEDHGVARFLDAPAAGGWRPLWPPG